MSQQKKTYADTYVYIVKIKIFFMILNALISLYHCRRKLAWFIFIFSDTKLDPVDSKLPAYIAVGCVVPVALAITIICVICYLKWKKSSGNQIKGCDNDVIKT